MCLSVSPFTFNMQQLSCDDCLEDKRKDYQNCSVLYCVMCTTTVVPNHMHTHEQFLLVNLIYSNFLVFMCYS